MHRRMRFLSLWIAALLVLLAVPVQAADGVQITLTPDRNELTVGDPIQLTLEVTHPAGTQVIIPKLDQVWGDLEVRAQSQATTEANDDGTVTTRQTIEATLFNLGEFETLPLPLTITDGAGQVREEMAPPVSLTVIPTLATEDTELRDIKPQAGLDVPATWPWIVGGLLLAAAIAVAGWWAYRRWRGEPFLPPAVDNRPAWQVAYDELGRIEGLGLLEQGRFKEYYTLVTDCLRTYLESQFKLGVFERTTSELRAIFHHSELAPDHARLFLELFAESDLVKFAKFTPDTETARRLTARARELVTLTRPRSESELAEFLDIDEARPEGKPLARSVTKPQLRYQSGQ
jgi:hypothetical protein